MTDIDSDRAQRSCSERAVELRVTPRLESLAVVRMLVGAIATYEDLDVDTVADLRLAIDELCTQLAANTLRDPEWNLILLDHSRAFGPGAQVSADLRQIDRELWHRIEGLTRAQLDTALRPWLDDDQIRAILDRRERMRAAIDRRP